MIDLSVLDDATIWVAVSFIFFIILIFKPMKSQISDRLDKKITDLKNKLDEAKNLKYEAEKLYKEHQNNLKINLQKIEKLKLDTKNEIKKIKKNLDDEFKLITARNNQPLKKTQIKLKKELGMN